MRFQTKKVKEEIKMLENAKIGFAEMDEDRNMKNGVWAQIAKINGVPLNQSTIEIILKHDQFITVGVGKLSP